VESQKKSYPASVWLALASVYLVWGSTYLAIHFAIATIPPFLMAGTRFLVAGLLLYFWARWRGEKRPQPRHWRSTAIIGFFLIVVANGGVSWVEQKVPSGIAALLVGTVPLWIVILEWAGKGGERPRLITWCGIFLGMLGIVLLVFSRKGPQELPADPWAEACLIFTSLAWAYGSLYARSAALPPSALLATSMEMITGGALQLLVGFGLGETRQFHLAQMTSSSIEALVYLTLIGSLVGFTSYIWVLQKSTPELASTYAFVNPVIAVFLGWLWAGESLTPFLFLSAGLIVAAVVLITLRPSKNPIEPPRHQDTKSSRGRNVENM
jgi:drug/metabolite transporter (DMT)-like permease